MNYYSIFYWLTVSDGVKNFFDRTSDIFTWFAVLSFFAFVVCVIGVALMTAENNLKNEEEDKTDPSIRGWLVVKKYSLRTFYLMLPLALVTWLGYMATPTKKDCLLIIAGGAVGNFLTTDSSAKALPSDVTNFLHIGIQNQIKDMSADIKKQLAPPTPKEKFIDKAEKMTKDELINYLKNDSTTVVK